MKRIIYLFVGLLLTVIYGCDNTHIGNDYGVVEGIEQTYVKGCYIVTVRYSRFGGGSVSKFSFTTNNKNYIIGDTIRIR